MAAFAAVATVPGRDANAPFPLLRMVGEYLTIDQLMPPCRLRWSRLLGHPMMGSTSRRLRDDIVGFVYIEELHTYEALIVGRLWADPRPHDVRQLSTLHRRHNRNQIWSVCIVDPDFEDAPYMEAWRLRYGAPWPCVGLYRVHPVLSRLNSSYDRSSSDVIYHGRERERENMWVRFREALHAAAREE